MMKSRLIAITLAALLAANMTYASVQANDFNEALTSKETQASKVSSGATATKGKIMRSFKENKDEKNYKKDEVLIKLSGLNDESVKSLLEKNHPITIKKKLSGQAVVAAFNSNEYSLEDILNRLNKDSSIEYAEPNYGAKIKSSPSSEPYYKFLWGLKNSQYPGIDINAEAAWKLQKNYKNTVVGVIDTGVAFLHEDLKQNLWINESEIPHNGVDDDQNGYADDFMGWNFVDEDNYPYDYNAHGTHVSGIISAASNDLGVVGVSPNTKIMALKVGDVDGNLYSDDIIRAIDYGVKKGVKVFNCSYSGGEFSQIEYEAIKKSNALFIAAAGNEGVNNDINSNYPANYDLPNVISVGSIDKNGSLSEFSNYGVNTVDIVAPGSEILSTVPSNEYDYGEGTSMAAPYVAGAAALILSENPNLSIAQLRDYILKNNRPMDSLSGKVSTGAMLDIGKIMTLLNGEVEKPTIENGWVNKSDKWYFYEKGQPLVGWQYLGSRWYYFNGEGIRMSGWHYSSSKWYYLDENGIMKTGWTVVDGKRYYLGEDGAMTTGWVYISSKWYYLNKDGDMATGWVYSSSKWYYLSEAGVIVTGWQLINGVWYFLHEGGEMATGWQYSSSKWYYLNKDGVMATGWNLIDGVWYYLYESGEMATNVVIDGRKLGPDGAEIH